MSSTQWEKVGRETLSYTLEFKWYAADTKFIAMCYEIEVYCMKHSRENHKKAEIWFVH